SEMRTLSSDLPSLGRSPGSALRGAVPEGNIGTPATHRRAPCTPSGVSCLPRRERRFHERERRKDSTRLGAADGQSRFLAALAGRLGRVRGALAGDAGDGRVRLSADGFGFFGGALD